jgi:hypothetical protein
LKNQVLAHNGKYFINPGSATGCDSKTASFILMAIQGDNVTAFIYESKGGEFNVSRIDFAKNADSQLVDTSASVANEGKDMEDFKNDHEGEEEKVDGED